MTEAASLFDNVAERYHRVRPRPPAALIQSIVDDANLEADQWVLEVGCGSGQATELLGGYDFSLVALDTGSHLLDCARERLRNYSRILIEQADFTTFSALQPFDALVSVQAFHWFSADLGLSQAARLLKPGAAILLAWHRDQSEETDFYRATQKLYLRYHADYPPPVAPASLQAYYTAFEQSPDWSQPEQKSFIWEEEYSGQDYLDLLQTYSDVLNFPTEVRKQFLSEMAQLISHNGGSVKRYFESVLLSSRYLV